MLEVFSKFHSEQSPEIAHHMMHTKSLKKVKSNSQNSTISTEPVTTIAAHQNKNV